MSARANQSVDRRRRRRKKKETVAIQYLDGCARLGKNKTNIHKENTGSSSIPHNIASVLGGQKTNKKTSKFTSHFDTS